MFKIQLSLSSSSQFLKIAFGSWAVVFPEVLPSLLPLSLSLANSLFDKLHNNKAGSPLLSTHMRQIRLCRSRKQDGKADVALEQTRNILETYRIISRVLRRWWIMENLFLRLWKVVLVVQIYPYTTQLISTCIICYSLHFTWTFCNPFYSGVLT